MSFIYAYARNSFNGFCDRRTVVAFVSAMVGRGSAGGHEYDSVGLDGCGKKGGGKNRINGGNGAVV